MHDDYISPELVAKSKAFLMEAVGGTNHWDDDPDLRKTPYRFARMIRELTSPDEFEFTTFDNNLKRDEMVVVRDIPFVALCAHHIVPFIGHAHVGYIPTGSVAGLSKFARAVQYWAHGLWTQEALTDTIATHLEEMLEPLGLAVVLEAEHMCMTIRGVQSHGTKTITSDMRGVFLDTTKEARNEFFSHLNRTQQ